MAKALLGLCVVCVALCALMIAIDPPWVTATNASWAGMAGLIASFLSAAPWSMLVLVARVGQRKEVLFVAAN
jgi:hypothetical protein